MDTDIIIRKIKENKPIWVGVLLIVLIVIAIFWHTYKPGEEVVIPKPGRITMNGQFTCLPFSDNATNTQVCKLGVKNGPNYYALDTSEIKLVVKDLKAEEKITIEGNFIPIASSTEVLKDYDIEGVIQASSLTRANN